jgi:hypothetical protein
MLLGDPGINARSITTLLFSRWVHSKQGTGPHGNAIQSPLFVADNTRLLHNTCLHAKNGFAMALQSSEEQTIPCITYTNGTVIRPHDQQLSGTFLSCGETTDCPRAMAFKDLKSFVVLKNTYIIINS